MPLGTPEPDDPEPVVGVLRQDIELSFFLNSLVFEDVGKEADGWLLSMASGWSYPVGGGP